MTKLSARDKDKRRKETKRNILSKKIKKKKNEDIFPSKKEKLGKKKQPPPGVTSFQSKAVYMPSQNVTEKKIEAVNHRKLTLKELLSQLNHYNSSIRKEALIGIKDILTIHPNLLRLHVGEILESIALRIVDEEKSVRVALKTLFLYIMSELEEDKFSAFSQLFSVYISSALTHLIISIRIDALDLINIWIDKFPFNFRQYCKELLPVCLRLLTNNSSAKSKPSSSSSSSLSLGSTSVRIANIESRISILNSLHKLLDVFLTNHHSSAVAMEISWDENELKTVGEVIQKNMYKQRDIGREVTDYQLSYSSSLSSSFLSIKELIISVTPLLIECWLECTPSEQTIPSETKETSVACMDLILSIFHLLFSKLDSQFSTDDVSLFLFPYLKDFLKYIFVYFPFEPLSGDSKMKEIFTSINISICSVMSYFITEDQTSDVNVEDWIVKIFTFITSTFESQSRDSTKISITKIFNLLDVFHQIVSKLASSEESRDSLLQNFTEYYLQCHPKSAIKQKCVEIISSIFMKKRIHVSHDIKEKWMLSFPKLLYQLHSSNLQLSHMILDSLSHCAQHNVFTHLDFIQNAFIPFFYSIFKPKNSTESERIVFGPFIKLPISIQMKAVQLMFHYQLFSVPFLKAFAGCSPFISPTIISCALEILYHKERNINTAVFLGYLGTLLILNSEDLQRCRLVAHSIAYCASSLQTNVLNLMETFLLDTLEKKGNKEQEHIVNAVLFFILEYKQIASSSYLKIEIPLSIQLKISSLLFLHYEHAATQDFSSNHKEHLFPFQFILQSIPEIFFNFINHLQTLDSFISSSILLNLLQDKKMQTQIIQFQKEIQSLVQFKKDKIQDKELQSKLDFQLSILFGT